MEKAVNHAEIGAYLAEKWLLPQLQILAEWYPRLQGEITSTCQFFSEP